VINLSHSKKREDWLFLGENISALLKVTKELLMIYEKQEDLIEQKRKTFWINRCEVAACIFSKKRGIQIQLGHRRSM
jgi:hypothetical protein